MGTGRFFSCVCGGGGGGGELYELVEPRNKGRYRISHFVVAVHLWRLKYFFAVASRLAGSAI